MKITCEKNPLKFKVFEDEYQNGMVSIDTILGFLCWPYSGHSINDVKKRYDLIDKQTNKLYLVPAENNILSKIVWPLRQSKACYVLSNYIGTISICGFIAEMLIILLFNVSVIKVNNKRISTEEEQTKLFGDTFEQLGQSRRINVLFSLGIISEKLRGIFIEVAKTRNKYIHFFSNEHVDIEKDAKRIFKKTEELVAEIIGQKTMDGYFVFTLPMLKYLERNGCVSQL